MLLKDVKRLQVKQAYPEQRNELKISWMRASFSQSL